VAKTWADLAGLRIGILGAGVEGRHAHQRLTGLAASMVVVDDNPDATMEGTSVLTTSSEGLEALEACDLIIKSPGFSRYRPDVEALAKRGIPILGSLGLSLSEVDPRRVIAVTGTKGKSTTASLIAHLAEALGQRTVLFGNIGTTAPEGDELRSMDLVIVEVSSFQALDLEESPGVVVVTSLGVDHLDWHGSVEQYQSDKLHLTRLPGEHVSVVQGRDLVLRSQHSQIGGTLLWSDGLAQGWADALGLLGDHNRANGELARIALIEAGVVDAHDESLLAQAAQGFTPLHGRLSLVATHRGVSFIDDSLATNVTPTMAALDAFEGRRLALLLGGYDRGISYHDLLDRLATRATETMVIGLPDSGAALIEQLRARSGTTALALAENVADGVALGYDFASGDGIVLLSPAAPSFSQFQNWEERSGAFRQAVAALTGSEFH